LVGFSGFGGGGGKYNGPLTPQAVRVIKRIPPKPRRKLKWNFANCFMISIL
jgi:hypothetical protein